jgi:hypothetical protein
MMVSGEESRSEMSTLVDDVEQSVTAGPATETAGEDAGTATSLVPAGSDVLENAEGALATTAPDASPKLERNAAEGGAAPALASPPHREDLLSRLRERATSLTEEQIVAILRSR